MNSFHKCVGNIYFIDYILLINSFTLSIPHLSIGKYMIVIAFSNWLKILLCFSVYYVLVNTLACSDTHTYECKHTMCSIYIKNMWITRTAVVVLIRSDSQHIAMSAWVDSFCCSAMSIVLSYPIEQKYADSGVLNECLKRLRSHAAHKINN